MEKFPQTWQRNIPKYNARYQQTLESEHEYFFHNGKILKKGIKFSKQFPVTHTPDHFYHPDTVSEQEAKADALAYIQEVSELDNILVYQWGANHKDPNKVTAVVVKMRYLAVISTAEEKAFYKKLRSYKTMSLVKAYPNKTRAFAKNKSKELKKLTAKKISIWKHFSTQVNKYIEVDFKLPFKK